LNLNEFIDPFWLFDIQALGLITTFIVLSHILGPRSEKLRICPRSDQDLFLGNLQNKICSENLYIL
jgi:hypothetical protein